VFVAFYFYTDKLRVLNLQKNEYSVLLTTVIDYCNSLLFGVPVAVIDKLQRAQNNVAYVICQQRKRVNLNPRQLLKSLHWQTGSRHNNRSSTRRLYNVPVQGFVDICPAAPRRTVAVSRDDAVATVPLTLCACLFHVELSERSAWQLLTSRTHYRSMLATLSIHFS